MPYERDRTRIVYLGNESDDRMCFSTAWDKFVTSGDGATIPVGWIVPEKPSSAAWQRCLAKENIRVLE